MMVLDSAARELLPLRPARRLLTLEPLHQRALDEVLVEHDGLVIGPVGHPQRDEGAQPEIAVGVDDRLQRFLGKAL